MSAFGSIGFTRGSRKRETKVANYDEIHREIEYLQKRLEDMDDDEYEAHYEETHAAIDELVEQLYK